MDDLMPISQVRANLPEVVEKVSKNMDRVVITVNGKPKAVVLSPEELESLEETAEVLAIPGAKKSIRKGRGQIKRGEFVSLDDLS
jgi:antitoxin YefM